MLFLKITHSLYLSLALSLSLSLIRTSTDRRQYEVMLAGIEKAATDGLRNAPCSLIYKCSL